jgi:hypothetical protein
MSGLFFYRYIYPKKKINLRFTLFLLSLLPLISLLRAGVNESGDFSVHVKFAMDFYKNLQEGILVPQWSGNIYSVYLYIIRPVYVLLVKKRI